MYILTLSLAKLLFIIKSIQQQININIYIYIYIYMCVYIFSKIVIIITGQIGSRT